MTHGGHQIKVGRAEASQGDLQRWCGRVTEIPGEKLFQVQDASGQTKDCKAIAQAGKGQDRPAFQTCPAPSCSQPTEQTSPCTAVPLGPSPQHVLQKHTLEQRPLLVRLPLPPTTRETELTLSSWSALKHHWANGTSLVSSERPVSAEWGVKSRFQAKGT